MERFRVLKIPVRCEIQSSRTLTIDHVLLIEITSRPSSFGGGRQKDEIRRSASLAARNSLLALMVCQDEVFCTLRKWGQI
jgi:hypothetical protein